MRKYGCIIIVLFIFVTTALTMRMTCKMPRISLSGRDGYGARWYTLEAVGGRNYAVANSYICPKYYEYEDWGFFILTAVELKEGTVGTRPIRNVDGISEQRLVAVQIQSEILTLTYEKDVATVYYNDELGNVYKTTIPENDPRVAVLLYKSKNKNRKKLVELWLQLNKEKEGHELIFDVNNPEKSAEKYKSEYF